MRIEELDKIAWSQEIPEFMEGPERVYCTELALVYSRYNAGRISKEQAELRKNRLRTELQQSTKLAEFDRQLNIEQSERAKNAALFKTKILKAETKQEMLLDALCCVYMLTGDKAFYTTAEQRLAAFEEVK